MGWLAGNYFIDTPEDVLCALHVLPRIEYHIWQVDASGQPAAQVADPVCREVAASQAIAKTYHRPKSRTLCATLTTRLFSTKIIAG
mmetsp:Transcript_9165/g.20236  ORF Transcript_9165/g.20236 Transcript_9165/m.20236 type:complete len:86 (-) Transcript_9165:377-634(-)